MWSPTHVQVTVQRARGLLTKGKNGTNDAFVTIALGKEKYQTSVKEKATQDVEWHEECELTIPKQGNVAEIVLTALHRNFLGVDEFLGVVHIPLADFDVYERPRNRWYELKSKPGKEKKKSRGELEVRVGFLVKAGSLTDLSKKEKHKSSLGQLSHMAHTVGGSLLSIGSIEKRKSLKKLAKSIVSKNKKHKENALEDQEFNHTQRMSLQGKGDADPGVISEGESDYEFSLDDLSYKSSGSSLNTNQPAVTPLAGSLENLAGGEFLRRTSTLPNSNPSTYANTAPAKPARNLPSSQERSLDEWEQKLYGKQGKDIYATNLETMKRRSWENPKPVLSSQPEEEEPEEVKGSSSSVPSTPVQQGPPTSHLTVNQVKKQEDMTVSPIPPELEKKEDEKEKPKEGSKLARKFKHFRRENKLVESPDSRSLVHDDNAIDGTNGNVPVSRLSSQVLQKFEGKSREDLIEMISSLQTSLEHKEKKLKDLEDYLDNLLLRVMETTPRILQNPYVSCKTQAKLSH